MNYTEYVGKMIGKAFGGKVFYKEKNDRLVQGVIILDGMVTDYKSKIPAIYQKCHSIHQKYLGNKVLASSEIKKLFQKAIGFGVGNPLDKLERLRDFTKYTTKFDLADFVESNYYCDTLRIYYNKVFMYDQPTLPVLTISFVIQDICSDFDTTTGSTVILFQIELDYPDLEYWLEEKGDYVDLAKF